MRIGVEIIPISVSSFFFIIATVKECADSVVVCKSYRQDAYKRRDYYMVDRSVCGIAVYDLDKSIRSGTGMTYNYAVLKKKLPVTVIHPDTDSIIK